VNRRSNRCGGATRPGAKSLSPLVRRFWRPRYFGCPSHALTRPSRPRGCGGGFFAFPVADATSAERVAHRPGTDARPPARSAAFRSENFSPASKSSNGGTPAKLFQVSTRRDTSHSAASFASSFAVKTDCYSSAPAGSVAWVVMLFSASIVNIDIDFSPSAACI